MTNEQPTSPAGNSGESEPRRVSRREARERAVELAYEAQMREWTVEELVNSLVVKPDPFVIELMERAEQNREQVDALLGQKAKGWSLDRMPPIDLVVMRIAAAELLTADTPTGVILSEAVELATRYSTEESGRFVNGVLAAIARDIR